MSAPEARPNAWAIHCVECGNMCGHVAGKRTHRNYGWWTCPCTPGDSVMHRHDLPMQALWGHEWALVAWLAENDKRQGVLYEYLIGVRTQADLCPPSAALDGILETLPEDAMQILVVNL